MAVFIGLLHLLFGALIILGGNPDVGYVFLTMSQVWLAAAYVKDWK